MGSHYKVLAAVLLIVLCASCSRDDTPKFSGPWADNANIDIVKALAKNKIRVCGEFYYRKSAKFSDEYQVKCIDEQKQERYFLVHPRVDGVVGPFISSFDSAFK